MPASHAAFMRPAKNDRRQARKVADVQSANSRKGAKLVAAQRQQIASQRRDIDRNSADCLRRINMKQRTGVGAPGCERSEILNRSDFGVRQSERDERGLAIERGEHARGIDSSVGVGRDSHYVKATALEFRNRSEDR